MLSPLRYCSTKLCRSSWTDRLGLQAHCPLGRSPFGFGCLPSSLLHVRHFRRGRTPTDGLSAGCRSYFALRVLDSAARKCSEVCSLRFEELDDCRCVHRRETSRDSGGVEGRRTRFPLPNRGSARSLRRAAPSRSGGAGRCPSASADFPATPPAWRRKACNRLAKMTVPPLASPSKCAGVTFGQRPGHSRGQPAAGRPEGTARAGAAQ